MALAIAVHAAIFFNPYLLLVTLPLSVLFAVVAGVSEHQRVSEDPLRAGDATVRSILLVLALLIGSVFVAATVAVVGDMFHPWHP